MTYNTSPSILRHGWARFALLLLLILTLSGCGLLGRGSDATGEVAEAEAPAPQVVPTFTATPEGGATAATPEAVAPSEPEAAAPAAEAEADEEAAEEPANEAADEPADDAMTETESTTATDETTDDAAADEGTTDEAASDEAVDEATNETADESTDSAAPRLFVNGPIVNVRQGPGIEYGLVGSVEQGLELEITGRNPLGDWWQVCCVNGQTGWIFGQLARAENAEDVSIAQDIPPAPVAAAPAPVQPAPQPAPVEPAPAPEEPAPASEEPAPEEPAPAPEEPAAEEPAPAPASDPCAGIGGDGCKFRVSEGPAFGPSGGELVLNLYFIHSGVDGGQPQGSYFIGLQKDGQAVGVSDGTRSIALESRQGSLGPFNYEYKIPAGELPGGSVAGNYTMWVIDGNGERDSQNTSFTVPEGQGVVRIVWNQG